MKKIIFITGASTGIGKASADQAVKEGHIVYAGYRKEVDSLDLVKSIPGIKTIKVDITKEEDIERAVQKIEVEQGKLDVLFNNAGIAIGAPVEFLPIEELKWQMDVNVTGQIMVTQKFLPLLRKSNDARIIFTSSISGFFSKPLIGAYAASKHAIEALADSLRLELNPWNIKVVLLQPGTIKTPIWEKSIEYSHQLKAKMGEVAQKYYGDLFKLVEVQAKKNSTEGVEVQEVVEAFTHALNSDNPKVRYLIGKDARIQYVVKKITSEKARDGIVLKALAKLVKSVK